MSSMAVYPAGFRASIAWLSVVSNVNLRLQAGPGPPAVGSESYDPAVGTAQDIVIDGIE